MDLAAEPHHDGSPRYLDNQAPDLGDRVGVRLRVPAALGAEAVHVRAVTDGEPKYTKAKIVERRAGRRRGDVVGGRGPRPQPGDVVPLPRRDAGRVAVGQRRRHVAPRRRRSRRLRRLDVRAAAGLARRRRVLRDLPGPLRPRHRRAGVGRSRGRLGDRVRLGHADRRAIGSAPSASSTAATWSACASASTTSNSSASTCIYLTPVFPARSCHRYDASTFDTVDPVLGGDAALSALVDAAHRRGIRVIGDLTTNHSGNHHRWFEAALADAAAPEAGYYYFTEHPHDYVGWFDVPTLPKFDLRSARAARGARRGRRRRRPLAARHAPPMATTGSTAGASTSAT